jgi:hypothetical protein
VPDAAPLGGAVTDAGGHFTIARVPRGTLLVEASHPDYGRATAAATPGAAAILTVPVPGGIRGEVREHVTGAPVTRFRIDAAGPDGRTAAATATRGKGGKPPGDGGFTLARLVPGRWRLTVAASGFRATEREVLVPASSTLGQPSVVDLRIELER